MEQDGQVAAAKYENATANIANRCSLLTNEVIKTVGQGMDETRIFFGHF
ncbi:hypothetical protein [uncultured Bartonella sp.]|nr:hypothetical protein [uncultured Bartonella sp.]